MIGQTHGMLKRLRDAGFETRRTRDTAGNAVWHVYDRHYVHNQALDTNTPQREYRGKVTSINPNPLFWGAINPGTPRYYFSHVTPTNQSSVSPRGMRARETAENYIPGSTMEELG